MPALFTVVVFLVGAILSRGIMPIVGRWGYERYIIEPRNREKDRKRNGQIRTLLKENLERNLELLESIENHLTGKTEGGRQLPTFNVDLPILESTAGLIQLEVVDDLEAYNLLDNARYELTHVARKIDWLADMGLKRPRDLPGPSTPHSANAADNIYYQLERSTLALVQSCQDDCRKAIEALAKVEAAAVPTERRGLFRKRNDAA